MEGRKMPWHIIIASALAGLLVVELMELGCVRRWLDARLEGTWWGLPWAILAVFWAGLGVWAFRPRKKNSGESSVHHPRDQAYADASRPAPAQRTAGRLTSLDAKNGKPPKSTSRTPSHSQPFRCIHHEVRKPNVKGGISERIR